MSMARQLDPVLKQLERTKPNVQQAVNRIDKIISTAPAGNFAILLAAARNALLGRRSD